MKNLSLHAHPRILSRIAWVALSLAASFSASAFDKVTEEQLAATLPKVDPEAAAEFFFYEEKDIDIGDPFSSVRNGRFRLKIFKELGILKLSPYKIRYPSEFRMNKINARVTKPNGEEIFLDSDTIETEVSDYNDDYDLRITSFTFPNLEVGDIVDLEYKASTLGIVYTGPRGLYQDFPSQYTQLLYQPLDESFLNATETYATYQLFKAPDKDWMKRKGDYYYVEGYDLPAEPEEKYSLPRLHIVPTMWFMYADKGDPKLKTFWEQTGQRLHSKSGQDFKATKEVKETLAQITAGSTSKLDSLRRAYRFCQTEIGNTSYGYGEISKSDRENLPKDQNATEVLKNKIGRPKEIQRLFGALATALGFEAQHALLPDKRKYNFSPNARFKSALPREGVAVKVDDEWIVLQPQNPHLPFGHVEPRSAGSDCLVGNKKAQALFVKTPKSDATINRIERSGALALDANGDLKGKIVMTIHGSFALGLRNRHHASSDDRWKTGVTNFLKSTLKTEFTRSEDMTIQNKRGSDEPLIATFNITIPGYADRSGDLLVVRPNVFIKGAEPFLNEDKRETDVFLMNPQRYIDQVKILMPEGYAFDSGSAPAPLPDNQLIEFKTSLKIDPKERAIIARREYAELFPYLPVTYYKPLRAVLAHVQQQDAVALTLAPQ